MLDYYQILGISRSADHQQIKAAYKKLALQYHPDRNPNNSAAEEYFKLINEAHQILSNPHKKAQYDLILNFSYQTTETKTAVQNQPRRKTYQRTAYKRHHNQHWGFDPLPKTAPPYKIDKNYFRVQFFSLGVVIIVAALLIGINQFNLYLERQKEQELKEKNDRVLYQAQMLYESGKYREAFDVVNELIKKNPVDSNYPHERKKMLSALHNQTLSLYQQDEYTSAVSNLEVIRDYQRPLDLSVWHMIADCSYKLKAYRKAVHALDYILIRDKRNIELAISIGDIYYDHLRDTVKALEYYTEAKNLFKQKQIDIYGNAFELVMPVKDTPPIYYDLFLKRGEINMAANRWSDAITDYNWAVFLRPENAPPYYLRGICKFKTGNQTNACKDWLKATDFGHQESKIQLLKYCSS